MNEEQLFAEKGKLTWQIEFAQAQLQNINNQLIKIYNEKNGNGVRPQIAEAQKEQ